MPEMGLSGLEGGVEIQTLHPYPYPNPCSLVRESTDNVEEPFFQSVFGLSPAQRITLELD